MRSTQRLSSPVRRRVVRSFATWGELNFSRCGFKPELDLRRLSTAAESDTLFPPITKTFPKSSFAPPVPETLFQRFNCRIPGCVLSGKRISRGAPLNYVVADRFVLPCRKLSAGGGITHGKLSILPAGRWRKPRPVRSTNGASLRGSIAGRSRSRHETQPNRPSGPIAISNSIETHLVPRLAGESRDMSFRGWRKPPRTTA